MINIDEQVKIIMKGVDEIIGLDSLKEKLIKSNENNKPLIVKLGLDPSAPDIHLGHTVVLRKMKQLQDLGHKVIIIIGDFTGKIGDPTGKAKGRKALTTEQVLENAKTYEEQIFKVLDKDKTEVRFNSEWLSKLTFEETIKLAATMTVARMLEREEFKKRYENQVPISVHEFFYPLMQGFDSVSINADIELGGTDQRFNVLMGRMLQKEYGQEPQATIFMPLLEGLDGKEKMSKSLGNYIGIDEKAEVMYEKAMTIPDELIVKYFNLVTDIHPDDIKELENDLKDEKVNPRDIKMKLAKEIVRLYHGKNEAEKAEERFKTVFQKGQMPKDIETIIIEGENFDIGEILVLNGFVKSKNELRRLVSQGGIKINNVKVDNFEDIKMENEIVIQIGKKKFVRLK
ncbi:tyrosine--tRNA ligase [Clostridium chromiireducens]|uniref:Tyrosine--tRNA ligase n=1 Tax=Clostridium chromiireducens TaxID=225345 RepID=A0A399IMX6_9CLOT|nr:tyrosine--tRNA ligase [Clostridium chromiireducens]RII32316.1 tyrosine--tRNA ligase [Clostridium chromiireducens]